MVMLDGGGGETMVMHGGESGVDDDGRHVFRSGPLSPRETAELVRLTDNYSERVFVRTDRAWLGFWGLRYWGYVVKHECGKYTVATNSGRIEQYMDSSIWGGTYRYFKDKADATAYITRRLLRKQAKGYVYFAGNLMELWREFKKNKIVPGQAYSGTPSCGTRIPAVPNPITSRIEEEINPINDPVKVEVPPPPSDPPRMINGRPARKIQL